MKLSIPSFCRGLLATAFALVTLTAASAADTFEGRVHMDMTAGKKKEVMGMDYAMKNGMLRIDTAQSSGKKGAGMGGVIMDYPKQEMIILMEHDGQKQFMRRSLAKTFAEAQTKSRDGKPTHTPPVATGRTEMIAGYKATEYRTTGEKGEITELWFAKGLGAFASFTGGNPMMGQGAPPPGWEVFARDGNLFPMRVVSLDASGNERSRMEVTKVEKTSLPDSLFSTDGYTEFKMPDFGGFNPFKR